MSTNSFLSNYFKKNALQRKIKHSGPVFTYSNTEIVEKNDFFFDTLKPSANNPFGQLVSDDLYTNRLIIARRQKLLDSLRKAIGKRCPNRHE